MSQRTVAGRRRVTRSRSVARRRRLVGGIALLTIAVGAALLRTGHHGARGPVPGSSAWAYRYYGNPDSHGYPTRNIVPIDFLGRTMFVNKKAKPQFLRLAKIFEARAPEYAAGVAVGTLDDWSYLNRSIRGEKAKSNHAFGLAIDINALANPLGGTGDMPSAVVAEWEREGGAWGGDFSRPDPMHFETHLTPKQIRHRYHADGSPRGWYLKELAG